MKQEAHKHHYIPRFILKNFNDENGQVNYWNIEKNKLEKRNIKSIFMNMDMYRDELLNEDDPTQIESKFSVFECEIADLIAKKILDKDEVVISRRELEKLRIFITLLSFRSNSRMEQYKNNQFDESTREKLLKFQPDGNFEELWKRELDTLATCRSYQEIQESDVIDPIIKLDFTNDLMGFYMTFIDARGGQFILSDIYPTLEIFPTGVANIHMHCMLPLSPTRMLLLNHIMFKKENENNPMLKVMRTLSQIKGDAIVPPKNKYVSYGSLNMDDQYIYKVKKVYVSDVQYMNALVLNETRVGIIFRDKDRIVDSISSFNERTYTKQKFIELENALK
ncbi:MAG: DUF4238 domain-containing protein [Erysipelotrichaceae bacterium]|nr:DUF4238 domain-containing protein [Erysipelotrichaceae bacterium]